MLMSTRHSTLLLPGAQLQVSPFKDLATMRDPTSSYSFVNYLHQQNRLSAFINMEANIPSRREWSAYLTWAARRMDDVVSYGEDVLAIEPLGAADVAQLRKSGAAVPAAQAGEGVRILRVTTQRRGESGTTVRLARNVTVGVGGIAQIPPALLPVYPASPWTEAARVIHSSTFLPSLAAIEPQLSATAQRRLGRASPASASHWPLRLAVVGSGQSAAETSLHLRRTFPSAHISLIFRASAIVPSDDSAFVNAAAFDPDRTDAFWRAGTQERADWIKEYKRTNYSVVRSDVLNALNQVLYDQQIEHEAPWPGADGPSEGTFVLRSNTQVDSSRLVGEGDEQQVELTLSSTKPDADSTSHTERFDLVTLGTGFARAPSCMKFLEPLAPHFPALDPEAERRRAELGFPGEDESLDSRRATLDAGGDAAEERLRERVRGISRDYRLVPYASPAFHSSGSASASGISSPGSSASSVTLEDSSSIAREVPGAFEPGVYVLGGNEQTHGLSDSLLSIVAWRAGELTESLLARKSAAARREAVSSGITADGQTPLAPTSNGQAGYFPQKAAPKSGGIVKPLLDRIDSALRI
jgi:lysine/ornithine N-monooxygenase